MNENSAGERGLLHVYCGDGKGKTTAAMGLALRALGQGRKVVIAQFLKDGSSGELEPLRRLGAAVYSGSGDTKFVSQMTEEEKRETRRENDRMLEEAAAQDCGLLVLDELCAACRYGLADEALAKKAVLERPAGREVVVTGRGPAQWMLDAADYITEMRCVRHPYERGIKARKGIEY